MKQSKRGITLVGGSSLLVIFSILCLTVFALLALSTVKADIRIADASVQSVKDYYKADCEAEAILAKIRQGQIPEGVEQQDGNRYFYTCPVSDTQELNVLVEVEDESFTIHQWKVVVTKQWSPEEYIEVWTPEEEE